jgi:hypothetical protein
MRALIVLLALLTACLDINVTTRLPCETVVTRGDSLSDTLYHATVSKAVCPVVGTP